MARLIKMPLGMEVGLDPGDIVLDGDPCSSPPQKGAEPPPIFCPCLLWINGYMDQDATWLAAGVVVSVIRRMNEVTLPRARLVLGWVTVFGLPSCVKGQLSLASSGVARLSTSFGWGKGRNVTSAGW